MMKLNGWLLRAAGIVALLGLLPVAAAGDWKRGTVVTEQLASSVLRETRTGVDPNRQVSVYLPPGYADSGKSYPVVYFFHSLNWSGPQVFSDGRMQGLLERGFASGTVKEFILVAADFSSPPGMGSLYENSATSGRWLDFVTQELVPFVDGKFRTLRARESRGLAGDFMGGRGALKLAMTHANLFSVVYALHPVATGNGSLPWGALAIDWKRVHEAKTLADLDGPGREKIFVQISQAFLPNPARPPFYCDFPVDWENGQPKPNGEHVRRAQRAFLLDESLDEAAANLRTMRGIAFDWGRFDTTVAHVDANRDFSRKLADLGIEHEAEEFNGDPWNRYWNEDGRVASRVLPFFGRRLVFD